MKVFEQALKQIATQVFDAGLTELVEPAWPAGRTVERWFAELPPDRPFTGKLIKEIREDGTENRVS